MKTAAELYESWMFTPDAAAIAAGGGYSTAKGAVAPQGLPALSAIPPQPTIPLDQIVKADNAAITGAKQYWGGILTLAARRNGIGGVVIDGVCRDIAESAEHGFPVFGRAVVPVSARGRIVQLAMDEPGEFAGITVYPGDVVFADQSGVVFISAAELDRVVALAERIVARESAMAEAVLAGNPVTEVMHDSRFPTIEEPIIKETGQ